MMSQNVTCRHGNVRSTPVSPCFGLHGIRNDVLNTRAKPNVPCERVGQSGAPLPPTALPLSILEFHRGYAASTLDLSSEDVDQQRPIHCPQRGSASVYAIHLGGLSTSPQYKCSVTMQRVTFYYVILAKYCYTCEYTRLHTLISYVLLILMITNLTSKESIGPEVAT